MNKQNIEVLTNIIGAVESGGQIYGKRNYKAYAAPYTNSPKEHTITLGWAQYYGAEAKRLIQLIYDINPANFRNIDSRGSVQGMLDKDWVAIRWKPSFSQKSILIKLIDSAAGHEAQDHLFMQLMEKFIADCERDYTKDIKAIMMYCEIRHLGGKTPADRIFNKCKGDYTLTNIMNVLKQDQADTSSSNQVGDAKYWSRHQKCYEFINRYAASEGSADMGTTIVKEFSKYIGTTEYNGIVATIQKWYYGTLVKDAWCATSTSYFANVAGIIDQIGGKHEGVYEMMMATKRLHKNDGRFFEYPNIPSELKLNDIIFFKRNGASHVAHIWQTSVKYTGSGKINVLGGNQSDMICTKDYNQNSIQAVYRPYYNNEERTYLKKGDNGADVKAMQKLLISNGYSCGSAGADGDFGNDTEKAVKAFQKDAKLTVDGIYGIKTKQALTNWRKGWIPTGTATVSNTDAVNMRSGAGRTYPVIRVLHRGNRFEVDGRKDGNWAHVKTTDTGQIGWISSSYIKYD